MGFMGPMGDDGYSDIGPLDNYTHFCVSFAFHSFYTGTPSSSYNKLTIYPVISAFAAVNVLASIRLTVPAGLAGHVT
jgi:hypothetical protein